MNKPSELQYLRLRQVCLAALDLEPATQHLREIFGIEVCVRDGNLQRYGLKNVLLPIGHNFLEIVAPIREGTAVHRFLDQRGGRGGYMLILDCHDAARRRDHAVAQGIRIANLIEYESYLGVQLHPRDTGATMIEFNRTSGGEDLLGAYYPAGPDWQSALRSDVTRGWTAVQITAPDAQSFAARWSELIELPLRTDAQGRPVLRLDGGDIRFVEGPAHAEPSFTGIELDVVDPQSVRAAARARGLLADDDSIGICGIEFTLVERELSP